MNQISWSQFRNLSAEKQEELMPCIITKSDAPFFVMGKLEDIIVLTDLHPRVRIQLKAQEQKARRGMPKPVIVAAS